MPRSSAIPCPLAWSGARGGTARRSASASPKSPARPTRSFALSGRTRARTTRNPIDRSNTSHDAARLARVSHDAGGGGASSEEGGAIATAASSPVSRARTRAISASASARPPSPGSASHTAKLGVSPMRSASSSASGWLSHTRPPPASSTSMRSPSMRAPSTSAPSGPSASPSPRKASAATRGSRPGGYTGFCARACAAPDAHTSASIASARGARWCAGRANAPDGTAGGKVRHSPEAGFFGRTSWSEPC